jgi:hypothetical protein
MGTLGGKTTRRQFIGNAVLLALVAALGVGTYRSMSTSVTNYSTFPFSLWVVALVIGVAFLGFKYYCRWSELSRLGLRPHSAIRSLGVYTLGIPVTLWFVSAALSSLLLPSLTSSPDAVVAGGSVEGVYSYRKVCTLRLNLLQDGNSNTICLRHWFGHIRGHDLPLEPGMLVDLEVAQNWLGTVVVGVRAHGA